MFEIVMLQAGMKRALRGREAAAENPPLLMERRRREDYLLGRAGQCDRPRDYRQHRCYHWQDREHHHRAEGQIVSSRSLKIRRRVVTWLVENGSRVSVCHREQQRVQRLASNSSVTGVSYERIRQRVHSRHQERCFSSTRWHREVEIGRTNISKRRLISSIRGSSTSNQIVGTSVSN